MAEPFASMLTGGHANSLGRTEEVVEVVLADTDRFEELFSCYQNDDEVVRLRTSSAMKRLAAARRDLLIPYIDRFLTEIAALDQPSAQWTLALLFARLASDMTDDQHAAALSVMQRNLTVNDDWIVLGYTMETLSAWAKQDASLCEWLAPQLDRLSGDSRKSVSKKATKLRATL